MKHISLIVVCTMLIWNSLHGTPDVCMEVYRFNATTSAYIEVSIYVVGSSLQCAAGNDIEYGVEYVVLVKDEADKVVAGNKYKLSREGCPARDIFDVKRFTLEEGKYTVEIEASDLRDTSSHIAVSQEVDVVFGKSSENLI